MKPDQHFSRNGPPRRPWAAISIGAFLAVFGVGASVYGFIAVTWSGDTNSQVVHVKPPESLPLQSETETSIDIDDADRPLRTSTTRRRSTPRSATKTPTSVPPTVGYDPDFSEEADGESNRTKNGEASDEDYEEQEPEADDESTEELDPESGDDGGESQKNGASVADPTTPEPTE